MIALVAAAVVIVVVLLLATLLAVAEVDDVQLAQTALGLALQGHFDTILDLRQADLVSFAARDTFDQESVDVDVHDFAAARAIPANHQSVAIVGDDATLDTVGNTLHVSEVDLLARAGLTALVVRHNHKADTRLARFNANLGVARLDQLLVVELRHARLALRRAAVTGITTFAATTTLDLVAGSNMLVLAVIFTRVQIDTIMSCIGGAIPRDGELTRPARFGANISNGIRSCGDANGVVAVAGPQESQNDENDDHDYDNREDF